MHEQQNYIEPILQKHFQKNISLSIDSVEFKAGKFLLYRFAVYANNYYIEFHIQGGKKIDMVKVPYPFFIEEHMDENLLLFDYRLKTFCKGNQALITTLQKFSNPSEEPASRFYDKILEIQFN